MSDLELRARSTSELVDAAVRMYRRDALRYMLVTALAYAPWIILQLLVVGTVSGPETTTTVAGLLTTLGMFVGFAVMSAVVAELVGAAYLGEHREIDDAFRRTLPRVPAVILATLLKYLLFIVGLVLLIVPGLYAVTRYFATTQAIVLERRGAGGAFSRSSELSKGLKWHIFGTLFLVWMLYFIASVALMMLSQAGGDLLVAVTATLFTVVAYPIVGITEVLLYYDTRVRREGYDIEVMSASLGAEPSASPVA